MKTLQEYIYEVSDEFLDRATAAALAQSKDKSLSSRKRKIKKEQAADFEEYKKSEERKIIKELDAYKKSEERKQIYQEYNDKQKIKQLVKTGITPKNKNELKAIIEIAFNYDFTNLNFIDTSKITNMDLLFYSNQGITHNFNVSNWNVSNVTTMKRMFAECENFTSDLSKWDVSNVTNMYSMFIRCENFNSDLSNWDVSKVEDMGYMFFKCEKFNSDLSNWDVSNVTNMCDMFWSCYNFNADLNNWDVSKVEIMKEMFFNIKHYRKPKWFNLWYKKYEGFK